MGNGHLGRTTISKHGIEILTPNTTPVRSALYKVSPKFEKAKIYKTLAKNVIEFAQIEFATMIIVVPEKDETL